MRKTLLFSLVVLLLAWLTFDALAKGGEGGSGKSGSAAKAQPKGGSKHGKEKAKSQGENETEDENSQAKAKSRKEKENQEQTQTKAGQAQEEIKQDRGRGKDHAQQSKAMLQQRNHEQAKHMQRRVRLERIRKLAEEKGNDKLVAKVDELMAKEMTRHERKMQRLAERTQDRAQFGDTDASELDKVKRKGPDKKAEAGEKPKAQQRRKITEDDDEDKEDSDLEEPGDQNEQKDIN